MKQQDDAGKFDRRDFLTLWAAGVTLAAVSPLALAAEEKVPTPETFMMFPGNYTWSAAVRGAIATCMFGGGDLGEIYKVCAALQGKTGDNAAWFEEWKKQNACSGKSSYSTPVGSSGSQNRKWITASVNYFQDWPIWPRCRRKARSKFKPSIFAWQKRKGMPDPQEILLSPSPANCS